MQTYKKSLISMDMGIMFYHRVDATQLPNTLSIRENFLKANLRIYRVLP
jgi:hypothetical protein